MAPTTLVSTRPNCGIERALCGISAGLIPCGSRRGRSIGEKSKNPTYFSLLLSFSLLFLCVLTFFFPRALRVDVQSLQAGDYSVHEVPYLSIMNFAISFFLHPRFVPGNFLSHKFLKFHFFKSRIFQFQLPLMFFCTLLSGRH